MFYPPYFIQTDNEAMIGTYLWIIVWKIWITVWIKALINR